jgi:hypothetical protein
MIRKMEKVVDIGGHLVRYPWSAILDWAWYRNFQYRTERAESDIISDIRIKFYPISVIRHSDQGEIFLFLQCRILEWTLMSISEQFRYRNDVFQPDIFVSAIGIAYVDVGNRRHWDRCRCPPMVVECTFVGGFFKKTMTWRILVSDMALQFEQLQVAKEQYERLWCKDQWSDAMLRFRYSQAV